MKIAFVPQSCIPFEANTLERRPLGGIETAVIRLAEALEKQGAHVTVFTPIENPALSSPLYLPFRAIGDLGEVDALIAVRDWRGSLLPLSTKTRMFWTGDSYDQPQTMGIGDKRVIAGLDRFLAVSNWHARTIHQHSGFPQEKITVLRNGIRLDFFEDKVERVRKRMIYSSTPYRGLVHLPSLFQQILNKHPEAELHVFSGYEVYGGSRQPASALAEFEAIKADLQKLPNCTIHGNVLQQTLAREFLMSSVLAYPNSFEETSCITAMEAQAAGCAVVTSELGALPETVGDAGVFIPGTPGTEEYAISFVQAVDRLFSDEAHFTALSQAGMVRAKDFSWNKIAQNFILFLEDFIASNLKS